AEQRHLGELASEGSLDQPLAADIQVQFDVVLRDRVSPFAGVQVTAHQNAYCLSGPGRCGLRLPQIDMRTLFALHRECPALPVAAPGRCAWASTTSLGPASHPSPSDC